MSPEFYLEYALDPALTLLPHKMASKEAKIMIIAICLQESRLQYRKQLGGPARGFAQFEKGGGVRGVMRHSSSGTYAQMLCQALNVPWDEDEIYEALAWNDLLSAGFARLLLWTLPDALPTQAGEGWKQYLSAWRPGKPHPNTWNQFYHQAFASVENVRIA